MKIYCDKCNKDISLNVDSNIEKFIPGRIRCPYCGKVQERYLSEADLMMYFTSCSLLYIIAIFLFNYLMKIAGIKIYTIIIIAIAFVGIYFIQKTLSRAIYKNAYCKAEIKNKQMLEDSDTVSKKMRTQYSLFTCLIILLRTGTNDLWVFILPAAAFTIISYIKLRSLLKKEKGL